MTWPVATSGGVVTALMDFQKMPFPADFAWLGAGKS
jgi:hypothetical protein